MAFLLLRTWLRWFCVCKFWCEKMPWKHVNEEFNMKMIGCFLYYFTNAIGIFRPKPDSPFRPVHELRKLHVAQKRKQLNLAQWPSLKQIWWKLLPNATWTWKGCLMYWRVLDSTGLLLIAIRCAPCFFWKDITLLSWAFDDVVDDVVAWFNGLGIGSDEMLWVARMLKGCISISSPLDFFWFAS